MKKTTISIVIEHHTEGEFQTKFSQAADLIVQGFTRAEYDNDEDEVTMVMSRTEREA